MSSETASPWTCNRHSNFEKSLKSFVSLQARVTATFDKGFVSCMATKAFQQAENSVTIHCTGRMLGHSLLELWWQLLI